MVNKVPSSLLTEPATPGWATRAFLRMQQVFQPIIPTSPTHLADFVSTSLPDPAPWLGCVIYVSDVKKVGVSNGAAWTDPAGGAL